eukprot:13336187-Heterocapsa_arctica.AAC.1
MIHSVELFKCDHYSEISAPSRVALVKTLSLYASNYDVILEIFYYLDVNGDAYERLDELAW